MNRSERACTRRLCDYMCLSPHLSLLHLSRLKSAEDAEDLEGSCGYTQPGGRGLRLSTGTSSATVGADPNSVFITQTATLQFSEDRGSTAADSRSAAASGGQTAEPSGAGSTARLAGTATASASRRTSSGQQGDVPGPEQSSGGMRSGASSRARVQPPQPPAAPPLPYHAAVKPVIPEPGQEHSPVYGWHNKFVGVRQGGRAVLQRRLQARAEVSGGGPGAAVVGVTLF